VLSGAEDLVPGVEQLPLRTEGTTIYKIVRYRPRVETLYARIERWTTITTGETHWRATTKDNVQSFYGRTTNSRIADPEHPERVFSWLLDETRDGKGNRIVYTYKPEDQKNINRQLANEAERPIANAYLKTIQYGNQTKNGEDWLFQVLFDYGEHNADDP